MQSFTFCFVCEIYCYLPKAGTPLTSFFFLINLFIYLFIHSFIYLFLAVLGLRCCARAFSSCRVSGGFSLLQCEGLPLRWLLLRQSRAPGARASTVVACELSSCGSWALERRPSSCGARAQLFHGMWDPPRPWLKPVSPALAGGFPTTAPPGKSQETLLTSREHLPTSF